LPFPHPAAEGQDATPPSSFRTGGHQRARPCAASPNNLHQWARTRKYQSAAKSFNHGCLRVSLWVSLWVETLPLVRYSVWLPGPRREGREPVVRIR
jgi:hypothetical protein